MHEESAKSSAAGAEWAKAWADMFSRFAEATGPPGLNGLTPEIALEARTAQLKWWSDYFNRLMRSQGFLDTMKDSMAAASQSRKAANDFLGEVHHTLQEATREDIDHLSRSLRHQQREVGAALRDIRRRLARLSRDVAELKNGRAVDHPAETARGDPPPALPNASAKPRARKRR